MDVVSVKYAKKEIKRTNNNSIILILRCYYKEMISYIGHPDQEEHGLAEKTES